MARLYILFIFLNLYDASKPEVFEKNWNNDKFAALVYLHGLFQHTIDDEKVARARVRMAKVLDGSVSATSSLEDDAEYVIHRTKVIDLSKIDVDELRKEIKVAQYKAIEIDDLKDYIEKALQQMLNKNCTRCKFSQRYRNIIDRYNAGGSENEDYYEQLIKLIEDMQKENERANTEGLTEEELEIYDLLVNAFRSVDDTQSVPGTTPENCGNYLMHNLGMAKWYASRFADYLSENSGNPKIFEYPKTERLVTGNGQEFFDS